MHCRFLFCTLFILSFSLCMSHGSIIKVDGTVELGSNVTDYLKKILNKSNSTENYFKEPSDDVSKYVQDYIKDIWDKNRGGRALTSGDVDIWSAASVFINNLVSALTKSTGDQIVQQSATDKNRLSLLEVMKSGRINGPVHVYGRHGGRNAGTGDIDNE